MGQGVGQGPARRNQVSLLYLDLDKFKQVKRYPLDTAVEWKPAAQGSRRSLCGCGAAEADTVCGWVATISLILLEISITSTHARRWQEKIREQLNIPFANWPSTADDDPPASQCACTREHADEQQELWNLADRAM